ncbi:ATP-binding cassette domain-containing protein [Bacteroides sp.]|uniref:ABC transporter ATP-binding protein n=1 Tax=Bacteroides sp. TaxID=29523 RepID=UPI002627883D|nr:ATP-binding cassette domain-containing protein [Bacteroides sp.]MDD3038553.1 ATP-binding cassette domain-containing protein [Bacteroides sp.]
MLHINNACVAFRSEVLFSKFNLHLEKGETACIVGQSGCGKTSVLNAVMGFVPLKEGTIRVGETLLDKSTIDIIRRQIAWIPQELALPFEWVKEIVALPFDLKVNHSIPFSEERLFACFNELGLEHELYFKRVNEVSGGQRQRIMLAVAAMLNKPLIIIDEPTSALDADSTDRVLTFFRQQAKKGAAVLAVSHDKDFASGCHYVIEL